VKDGSLLSSDFKAGQIPAGPKGATGSIGAVTAYSFTAAADMTANQSASFTVNCPAGMRAVGGGGRGDDQDSEKTTVGSSRPALSTTTPNGNEPPPGGGVFDGWRITVKNVGANAGIRPTVWVFCAAPPTT
jgi:hypothetical protein